MKVYSLEEIEEVLAKDEEEGEQLLLGQQVDWHGQVLTYTEHGLEKMFTCVICGQEPEVYYIRRGAPGWCYVFTQAGEYKADLRNQDYYCSKHTGH